MKLLTFMVSLVYIRNHGEWYFNKAIVGGRTLWANMNVAGFIGLRFAEFNFYSFGCWVSG